MDLSSQTCRQNKRLKQRTQNKMFPLQKNTKLISSEEQCFRSCGEINQWVALPL